MTRKQVVILSLALIIGAALAAIFANQVDAAKYPPGVAALVKLKTALVYRDGAAMNRARRIRVNRNISNAYRKNKNCSSATSEINLASYYFARRQYSTARTHIGTAINKSYACRDKRFYDNMNR